MSLSPDFLFIVKTPAGAVPAILLRSVHRLRCFTKKGHSKALYSIFRARNVSKNNYINRIGM